MNRIILGLAFALTVTSFPAVAGDSVSGYVFVGEDQDGNIVVREVPFEDADHYTQCGGSAPANVTCTNGPHGGTKAVFHGFLTAPQSGFSGYHASTLTDNAGNVRYFTCTFTSGTPSNCQGSGTFPRTAWSQRCIAHGSSARVPGVTPGGPWGCWSDDA